MFDELSTSRRGFVAGAALAGAVAAVPSLAGAESPGAAIRPFKVHVPQADLVAMKRRIRETRWADAQPAPDDGQGVRRQTLKPLLAY